MIAGRAYALACADGEEERLEALAGRIDDEARRLSRGAAQISEARLLLMSALMIADKLDETETAMTAARQAPRPVAAPPPPPPPALEPEPAPKPPAHSLFAEEENEEAAKRIEKAMAGLETALEGDA